MRNQKFFFSVLSIVSAILVVILFWRNTPALIVSLVFLGVIKHKVIPIKREFLWFIVSAFVGTTSESLAMLSGPWAYATINIYNFPLWLPFLWGFAGITGISLYQSITSSK